MKIKRIAGFIAAACFLIVLALFAYANLSKPSRAFGFVPADFAETAAPAPNPYCGFYHLYGFALTDEDTAKAESLAKTISSDGNLLALLQINLREFRSRDLTPEALAHLEVLLSAFETSRKSYILRFLYDWNGKSKETEPEDISRILSHIEQAAPVVNRHKDAVYLMQGIFTGDCGEMHGSFFTGKESMLTLIDRLHQVIDPSIFLSVRTPAHYRTIAQRFEPLSADEAYSGSLPARLGLFNDGMLGSDFDLGTYGPDSLLGQTSFDAKGTRAEEIAFQNALCSYVPNGGECVLDNPYNDFEPALADLAAMHVSYLNCDYDAKVLNKWKDAVYKGSDVFFGCSGYDYVRAHLGYRYVLTGASFSERSSAEDTADRLFVALKNTGFSSAYRRFSPTLTLTAETPGEAAPAAVAYESSFDNRLLLSGEEKTVGFSLDASSLEPGNYRVYFRMEDRSRHASPVIAFGNAAEPSFYGVFVGTLSVTE